MLQIDVSYSQEKFRSHLRITQMPNRVLKKGIATYAREGDLEDVIEWRWHATTNANDKTYNKADVADSYGAALTQAKAEIKEQYKAAGIPEDQLAHLDHLE